MRFLCDTCVSGGGWVAISSAVPVPAEEALTLCNEEIRISSWHKLRGLTPDATHAMEFTPSGSRTAGPGDCGGVDVLAPTSAVVKEDHDRSLGIEIDGEVWADGSDRVEREDNCLGPNSSGGLSAKFPPKGSDNQYNAQLTGPQTPEQTHHPPPGAPASLPQGQNTGEVLELCPLKVLTLHVVTAGGGLVKGGGGGRTVNCPRVEGPTGTGRELHCLKPSTAKRGKGGKQKQPARVCKASGDGLGGSTKAAASADPREEEASAGDSGNGMAVDLLEEVTGGGTPVPSQEPILAISCRLSHVGQATDARQVAFTHGLGLAGAGCPGVQVRVYETEGEMLSAWRRFVVEEADPDILCVYQLKESLKYIMERWRALKMGPLELGRRLKQYLQVGSRWPRVNRC